MLQHLFRASLNAPGLWPWVLALDSGLGFTLQAFSASAEEFKAKALSTFEVKDETGSVCQHQIHSLDSWT